jgi:hypothetical protein
MKFKDFYKTIFTNIDSVGEADVGSITWEMMKGNQQLA